MKVASLGMYDQPAQEAANDQLWAEVSRILRARGVRDVPRALDRGRPVQDIWRAPKLLFGQICGYPLAHNATLALRVLALPIYDTPGCVGDTHCSFIVARRTDGLAALEDYRGRRAAINSADSNSGMNLFRAAIAEIAGVGAFFESVQVTGSHRASVAAIVADAADIAAIDAVTFSALASYEPELTRPLHVVARTATSPTLPFVTSRTTDIQTVAALQIALAQALADPGLATQRDALFLKGATPAGIDRFASLLQLERDAALADYPDLR